MPPGNRNAEQPKIPGASVRRTREGRTTFDDKFDKIRDLLAGDRSLISKIKQTARQYDIDPIHIVGAIVGEHTYNVDAYDRLQSYYVKAAAYAVTTSASATRASRSPSSLRVRNSKSASGSAIPINSGPAAKMSGSKRSEVKRSMEFPTPMTASALYFSNRSMQVRHSVWASSTR